MTDDMDFTKPQPDIRTASAPFKVAGSRFYDSRIAGEVFRDLGREEPVAAQQIIFKEQGGSAEQGPSRMYFLAEGEVTLTIEGRPLEMALKGEVFGEMAVITGQPRSATARARKASLLYSMDAAELTAAVARNPEFGLMLASVMYDRLRFVASQVASRTLERGSATRESTTIFEPGLVAQLEGALPRTALMRYDRETLIFKEGQAGTLMYLVKEGRVAVAVGGNIVEVVGPGGTFGEMAVVDQSPRTARAGALEDTVLVAMDRATLIEVVRKHPAVAIGLLRGVAERLRHMNAQLR